MKKLSAVVVGYGMRGSIYAGYATKHPEDLEIVGVADANPVRRETAKQRHSIPDDRIFSTWEELAAQPKMADFAIVATQDNMHYAPAMALIEKGYNLLLEKPMAPTAKECKDIADAADRKGVRVVVCHVLRFTNIWRAIKNIVDEDKLGKIVSIAAMENVGHIHQSHSYVRGHWRNTAESSCMIMAKCCHDMDILQWLLGKKCTKVQSFGRLSHFTPENRPAGAPDYCIQGCPVADTCHYNAVKLYLEDKENLWFRRTAAQTIDMEGNGHILHEHERDGRGLFRLRQTQQHDEGGEERHALHRPLAIRLRLRRIDQHRKTRDDRKENRKAKHRRLLTESPPRRWQSRWSGAG